MKLRQYLTIASVLMTSFGAQALDLQFNNPKDWTIYVWLFPSQARAQQLGKDGDRLKSKSHALFEKGLGWTDAAAGWESLVAKLNNQGILVRMSTKGKKSDAVNINPYNLSSNQNASLYFVVRGEETEKLAAGLVHAGGKIEFFGSEWDAQKGHDVLNYSIYNAVPLRDEHGKIMKDEEGNVLWDQQLRETSFGYQTVK